MKEREREGGRGRERERLRERNFLLKNYLNYRFTCVLAIKGSVEKFTELMSNFFADCLDSVFFYEIKAKNERSAEWANVFLNTFSKAHHLYVIPVFRTWKWEIFFKECLTTVQLNFCMFSVSRVVPSLRFNMND